MRLTMLCLTMSLLLIPNAYGQQRTGQGAVLGGATGAVIGGIIGHQNDETPEGALIGGAVGAIAGGLIGRAKDNQIAQQRYYQQQAYQQHVYVQQQTIAASGMSSADVVAMCRSGLSDSLIMGQLNSRGVQRRLEVSEIISLHQQGVSDHVISAMQSAPLATQLATPVYSQQIVTQASPVIVHQQPVIYQSPVTGGYYRPKPVYHHTHHYHSGNGARVGF